MNDYDKELIAIINTQVQQLQDKNAEDAGFIHVLADLIPDVLCYLDSIEKGQIQIDAKQYPGFFYFADLIKALR